MVLSKDYPLFVANANRNTVSVLDTVTGHLTETLLAELTPTMPHPATPRDSSLSAPTAASFRRQCEYQFYFRL